MSRFLLVDIGAGTMDVLYFDTQSDLHYKAVVCSPVRELAQCIRQTTGDILVHGCEMGGGAVSSALAERARNHRVVMSAAAAQTVHHDPQRVRAAGIRIEAELDPSTAAGGGFGQVLQLGDVEPQRLEALVRAFGVEYRFDAVAFCAQDHGQPPSGVSHLDFRHNLFQEQLQRSPHPHKLLYAADEIPPPLSRLKAIAEAAQALPTEAVYVMDSGMAAISGASLDPRARDLESVMVLDVATSHTVGALLTGQELAGFFEYHTHDITLARLETLLVQLADGKISHAQILQEGGHGAYCRHQVGFDKVQLILATGPHRRLLAQSRLPIAWGAPLGDNMMTGTAGLLEALRRRMGLAPINPSL
jgi:uncharacterized protein (DUF1786 family)